jgi:hypothetical protein
METRCPACGMSNPEGVTACPCGAILAPQDQSDLQSYISRKIRNVAIWFVIFFGILAVILVLRETHGPEGPTGPGATAGVGKTGDWQTRELSDARISLMAPGPFASLPAEALGIPKEVRATLARADFYQYSGAGFDAVAGRMQTMNPYSIPPAPNMGPPSDNPKSAPTLESRFCVAGKASGSFMKVRFKAEGQDIEGTSVVLAAPPEMWVISISHLESDKSAGESAQRVIDSIRIDGQPLVILQSTTQSLTGAWRRSVLVPGSLAASAPMAWTEMEKAAIALDSQLPCRPTDARYFLCQCASTNFVVAMGTCDEDQGDFVKNALQAPSSSVPTGAAPQSGILLGRRAVVWTTEATVGQQQRTKRRVITADGKRSWLFEAEFPSGDPAAGALVERVQRALEVAK